MDIFKGFFFLILKFTIFPFILTLSMECCLFPIREESQLINYKILYNTFIITQESVKYNKSEIMSAFLYVTLMILWTSIVICVYLATIDILEKVMRPTAFTYLFRSVIETKNWLHPCLVQNIAKYPAKIC